MIPVVPIFFTDFYAGSRDIELIFSRHGLFSPKLSYLLHCIVYVLIIKTFGAYGVYFYLILHLFLVSYSRAQAFSAFVSLCAILSNFICLFILPELVTGRSALSRLLLLIHYIM